ncbi:MAG: right-handed parallel beta-helix repeat-containing protein, partial [Promethearchaeota archaeon]
MKIKVYYHKLLIGSIIIWVIVVASPKAIADSLQSPQLTQDSIKATPQKPLFIDGNQNFSTMATNEGWSGTGTKLNPYNITGLEIINSSVHLIEIQNTDVHFSITGNTLDGISKAKEGIILTNVSNGKIMNNVINHTFVGIHLLKATNITISGNEISHSRTAGIFSSSSESLEIIGNTITKNGDEDALLNDVLGAGIGICCRYTQSSVVRDNQLIKNLYDCIALISCSWNVIQGNILCDSTFKWQGQFRGYGIGVGDT